MKTSAIHHPTKSRFIRVYDWQLAACDGNACASALMSFLEGWHNWRIEQAEYAKIYNTDDNLDHPILDDSGWQYHTNEQLIRGLMIYTSKDTINHAVKVLADKGFIETQVPERLKFFYDTKLTKWFLLRPDKINEWIDTQYHGLETASATVELSKSTGDMVFREIPATFSGQAKFLFFYWNRRLRIDNNRRPVTPTKPKLDLITARLREGRTVVELMLAIEGNAVSKWHQGDNPNGTNGKVKIYDSVELIFRDDVKVDLFVRYADEAGIIEASVMSGLGGKNSTGDILTPKTDTSTKAVEADLTTYRIIAQVLSRQMLKDMPFNKLADSLFSMLRADVKLTFPVLKNHLIRELELELGMVTPKYEGLIARLEDVLK